MSRKELLYNLGRVLLYILCGIVVIIGTVIYGSRMSYMQSMDKQGKLNRIYSLDGNISYVVDDRKSEEELRAEIEEEIRAEVEEEVRNELLNEDSFKEEIKSEILNELNNNSEVSDKN